MRRLALAGLLLAAACGKKPAPADSDSPANHVVGDPDPQANKVEAPPATPSNSAPPASSGGGSMVTDFKPYNAFRAHAAKVLHVAPDQVQGGAVAEDMARRMPNTIGNALAYTMNLKADPTREVRGWVTLDGTVITGEQNLGLLLVEAGVWAKAPTVQAGALAEHLAWSYGMSYRVVIEPENGAAAPRYKVAADGTGTFRFCLASQEPGPGGAGGGPSTVEEFVVALSANHEAKLTRTPLRAP